MHTLSKSQVDFFFQEGYIIVKGVYTKEEIESVKGFFEKKFETGFWKNSEFNSHNIINDIYRYFPELTDVIFKPAYIGAVEDILGAVAICIPECCVHHNRFFDWHRDTSPMEASGETIHRSGNGFLIQCCTYFQDNGPEGGGLTVVPGSHRNPDRFIKMHYGNFIDRVYYKWMKLLHRSTFHRIEKFENPIDIATRTGDLLIFNKQIDHRATFLRKKNGKPKQSKKEKFAVFNAFSNQSTLAVLYLQSLRSLKTPYANFLRQTDAAPALLKKSKELNFQICY